MADVKISGLPASTVPLAGTEVLPIVQSSTTKKVSIANVTAGRAVSALSFAPTGSALPVNGVFLPAANAVGFSTDSEERLRVFATGGVSIGNTTDPGATNLSVTGSATIQGLTVGKGAGAVATNTAVGVSALGVNSSGTQCSAFGINALGANTDGAGNAAFGSDALRIATASDNTACGSRALYAATSASQNSSGGRLSLYALTTGINNSVWGYSAGAGLTTGTDNCYFGASATQSGVAVTFETVIGSGLTGKGSGTAFIGGSSGAYNGANSLNWSITSDERIKKNIVENTDGLNKILQIPIFNFEYRTPEEIDSSLKPTDAINKQGVQIGTIAQRLAEILPECVKTESTGVMTVNSDPLTWYLINAVKELSAKLIQIESQFEGLK